jgi:hypothetical protein
MVDETKDGQGDEALHVEWSTADEQLWEKQCICKNK